MSDTVPFGKYKGRPVDDMLGDADYMAWLEAQPWFREKFKHIKTRRTDEAASRTPTHNRIQALFLDAVYCSAFVRAAGQDRLDAKFSEVREYLAAEIRRMLHSADDEQRSSDQAPESEWGKKSARWAARWRGLAETFRASQMTWTVRATFEDEGADVRLRVAVHALEIERNTYPYNRDPEKASVSLVECLELIFPIEIKPQVADDYPAVLRQMNRNGSRYLFTEGYIGEGATEEQFVAIFKASGKVVVFKRDVDALL